MSRFLGFFVLILVLPLHAASDWAVALFYDKANTALSIQDIQCPTAKACVAAGVILGGEDPKPTAVVTSDGGSHWSYVGLKQIPISLFFLNEANGWLVTEHALWRSADTGRAWKRVTDIEGIIRVYFDSEQHGWAIGRPMLILETNDGGKTWLNAKVPLDAAFDPSAVSFDWIHFNDASHGWIFGATVSGSLEPRSPPWLHPDRAAAIGEVHSSVSLFRTSDRGATWAQDRTGFAGSILNVAAAPDGEPLAVVRLRGKYIPPTDVMRLDFHGGPPVSLYRHQDRVVTGVAVAPDGSLFLAAIDPPGTSTQIPIPGRVRVLRARLPDLDWTEMTVDYRAVAQRAILAVAGDDLFIATDTGMILKHLH